MLRNAATHRSNIRSIERRVTGITAEDPENADALVRAHRRPLTLNGIGGPANRRRKSDAVFRIADVVVHRLRNRDYLETQRIQTRGVTQRIIAADGYQIVQLQRLQIFQHPLRHVISGVLLAVLLALRRRKIAPRQKRRNRFHLGRIRAARMQKCAARALDRARIVAGQRQYVARLARRVVEVDVGQALPPAAQADHFIIQLTRAIRNAFNDGVQARDIAPASQDPNSHFFRHR